MTETISCVIPWPWPDLRGLANELRPYIREPSRHCSFREFAGEGGYVSTAEAERAAAGEVASARYVSLRFNVRPCVGFGGDLVVDWCVVSATDAETGDEIPRDELRNVHSSVGPALKHEIENRLLSVRADGTPVFYPGKRVDVDFEHTFCHVNRVDDTLVFFQAPPDRVAKIARAGVISHEGRQIPVTLDTFENLGGAVHRGNDATGSSWAQALIKLVSAP